ncbi:hypothetical protein F5Y12DRAFT_792384 [Xylaria sp. FL1777]|nr:hypothetical protein F5Y12DRAFT_792384 [Xylaria sp. FL1777]
MEIPTTEAWSTTKEPEGYTVYLGLWTNWSRGSVLGRTLTVSRRDGDLLIAFTAFFIAFVGSRFWRIACLAAHRFQSSSKPENAIYHQRQVILRNTGSADSGLLQLLQLFWAWRHSVRIFRTILPAFALSIFCVTIFTVAGVFSSQITSSVGTEVLLIGTSCGQTGNVLGFPEAIFSYIGRMERNALNYVQQCYSNSTSLTDCDDFATRRISTFVNVSAPCPFDSSVCRSPSKSIILDTGYVNSHYHLGVNAPPNERILFRRILQCAPLETASFEGPYRDSLRHNFTLYNYGPSGYAVATNESYTYKFKDILSQYDGSSGDETAGNYVIEAFPALVVDGEPYTTFTEAASFIPDTRISRTDADIHLIFLSGNGVVFSQSMDDEWYRATSPFGQVELYDKIGNISTQTTYRPDETASPLGCIERSQLCFANFSTCSPLASFNDAVFGAYKLTGLDEDSVYDEKGDLTAKAKANPDASRLDWFISTLQTGQLSVSGIINTLGSESLVSSQTLEGGLQLPLPLNQWQIDITHIWAISQASLQAVFVEVAHGLSDPDLEAYKTPPTNSAQQEMCNNQKIKSTAYASFNLFALLFTYILGILIVVLSFSLEPFLEYIRHKWDYETYAQLEWTTNSTLQLHRLVHDCTYDKALTWSHCVDTIPTTNPGINLAGLDIEDIKHPVLKPRTSSTGSRMTASSHTLDEGDQHHSPSSSSSPQMSSTVLPSSQQDYILPHPSLPTSHDQYPVQLRDVSNSTGSADDLSLSRVPSHHQGAEQTYDTAPPVSPSRRENPTIPVLVIEHDVVS